MNLLGVFFLTQICYFVVFQIIYMLLCSDEHDDSLEDAIYIADIGIMLGSRVTVQLPGRECDLLSEVATMLSKTRRKLNKL